MTHEQLLQLSAKLKAQWAERAAHGLVPLQATEPSLSSGKVLTPTIDVTKAPGLPTVLLHAHPGSVGIEFIQVEATSPSFTHNALVTLYPAAYPPPPSDETLRLQLSSPFTNEAFGLYAEPGAWAVSSILLVSQDGTFLSYSGSAVFADPTINVINPGTPDVTAPSINHGTILTPGISLSDSAPYFAATLGVSDDLSGVANLYVTAVQSGTTTVIYAPASIGAPVLNGKLTAAAAIPSGTPTGTYTINTISVCDFAQNCVYLYQPAQISQVFKESTFQITN